MSQVKGKLDYIDWESSQLHRLNLKIDSHSLKIKFEPKSQEQQKDSILNIL